MSRSSAASRQAGGELKLDETAVDAAVKPRAPPLISALASFMNPKPYAQPQLAQRRNRERAGARTARSDPAHDPGLSDEEVEYLYRQMVMTRQLDERLVNSSSGRGASAFTSARWRGSLDFGLGLAVG